jgi:CubicO group peptidase (beta-lactamase class C family)
MVRIGFLALSALLAVRGAASADPLDGFDAYVRKAISDWEVPAFAIAVVKDGEVVFQRGYGVLELGKAASADEHTLFAIGSTTKAMTAAAIGMLVDEGKLAWDDPVTKHLPWFQLRDPYLTREVTVRDLLTHRAGLPNTDFLWYEQENGARDILSRMRYVPSETSLRSHFTYQNVMYAAAGAVVSQVSGMPWEEFVRARIFEPLGMNRTVSNAARLRGMKNVASPHYRIDGKVEVIENASVDAVAPAGSVWSSVADMARWMRFLLEGKTADGALLLKEETLNELFRPQTMVGEDAFYPTLRLTRPHWKTYGLGWFQQDYDGRAVDFHTGSIDGMVAIHGLIRDERLGVYVLGNLDHAELRHALMYRVFDLYHGGPARDWNAEIKALYDTLAKDADQKKAEVEEKRVPGTRPSLPLSSYAGSYSDPLGGKIAVSADGDGLRLRYGPGLDGVLEHWNYDYFRVSWDKRWRGRVLVRFEIGLEGEVEAIEIRGLSFRREAEP